MSGEVFLLYLATWSLVALTPGPAVMCAMSFATRYGLRGALVGIAGLQLAHFVFFGCTAFGLAALLARATAAFAALRLLGACYLLGLGLWIVVSTFRKHLTAETMPVLPRRRSLLLQAFAIQVTNPKALLFMSALLPQFIAPERPLGFQLAVLLASTIAVDTIVLSAYAAFAARGADSLRGSGLAAWLERVFGAALMLFGIRLLATRR